MTTTTKKACDVFISHAPSDSAVAREIAVSLESAELEPYYTGRAEPGTDISDVIWDALAECRALIVVFSPGVSTHAMGLIEMGAAAAWRKPIFLLLNGPSSTKLPKPFAAYPVYPKSRMEEVIQAIHSSFEPLTEVEQRLLADIYQHLCIQADEAEQLANGTARFNEPI